MKVQVLGPMRMFVYSALAVFALCVQPARCTTLTADLTCAVTGSNSYVCNPLTDYGTVRLDDLGGSGQIQVTVDVQGIAGKFRDLMLNFNGLDGASVGSGDGQASLVPNGYSLAPYSGLFDIGQNGAQGWNSTTALYTTLLTGSGALTLAMFEGKDSLGKLDVLLQLQNLTNTGSSLKVGGTWEEGGGPGQEIVPEPATAALLGGGLLMFAWALRRRKAA